MEFPAPRDCNNPVHWDGSTIYVFNSVVSTTPVRSSGTSLFTLGSPTATTFNDSVDGARWMEATYKDAGGTLYGWYHNEPAPSTCPTKTAPKIGAVTSADNGLNWTNLGIILSEAEVNCATTNNVFAGGNGDCSVFFDAVGQYFYIFFTAYSGNVSRQGITVARVAYADRDAPVGTVLKWSQGGWNTAGVGGQSSPIFPTVRSFHEPSTEAFWGPAIHYNAYLNTYVLLFNRIIENNWAEGVYISFNPTISNPAGWSIPRRINNAELNGYPMVVGTGAGETDKLASQTARFFVSGVSSKDITFSL